MFPGMNLTLLLSVLVLPVGSLAQEKPVVGEKDFSTRMVALERKHGGRIGVAVLDLAGRRELAYRGGERFAMCSTFKLPLAAAVAARVDGRAESWDREIRYTQADVLSHAPVTGKPEHLDAGGMSVADLCAASMQWSDNTAANLLLDAIGGPEAFTRYLRSVGDGTTRLDRIEPHLNTNEAGDERDTTTPAAMVATMKKLLVGNALSPASRKRLTDWLIGNKTGGNRLRAGMDRAWTVGDKTGTGANGAVNDLAIVWPGAGKPPVLVAAYYTGSTATPEEREKIMAGIGEVVREAAAQD